MFPGLSGKQRAADTLYVEDVFSAFTYTGTGAAQSIVNGIDLAGKGGLVWTKRRDSTGANGLFDTARGVRASLQSESTGASATASAGNNDLYAFNSNGFSVGANTNVNLNTSAATYASWTFRKAAKFFDVVTYTGNGSTQAISHSLGQTPGMVIVKCTSTTGNWVTWHRSLTSGKFVNLNNTAAQSSSGAANRFGNNTITVDPTSTNFTVGSNSGVNTNGATCVAYLFAHDTSSDGIIQCGTFNTNGSGVATVSTLGWETQYLLVKRTDSAGGWLIIDTARGWELQSTNSKYLPANGSIAEQTGVNFGNPIATGFTIAGVDNSATYVYMAIRKGLMRTPTDATKVFAINARTGTGAAATVTAGSITTGVDLVMSKARGTAGYSASFQDRLRGTTSQLAANQTAAETTATTEVTAFNMDGVTVGTSSGLGNINTDAVTYINYFFKQARGFFDIVGYTGTGSAHVEKHNLGVAPELIILKPRSVSGEWRVFFNLTGSGYDVAYLEQTVAKAAQTYSSGFLTAQPTDTDIPLGTNSNVNGSGTTYVAYLFASAPGVSKIGTYTGNATTNQINCGFAAGARFVLIKRIDSTGYWYFWDTTRGIVSGNDPYLLLNSTAIEVTSTDYIDPYSAGFELSSTAPAALNASGGTFMFLAIA